MRRKQGFTLIELLIVVLLLGLLATMALPYYMRAVERSRMAEAITLLENIASAQQRKYMQVNRFMNNFTSLDVALSGASGSVYYTKGNAQTGANGNGFAITLYPSNSYPTGYAEAVRFLDQSELRYQYTLKRLFGSNNTTCSGAEPNGQKLCADYCGIEDPVESCCSDGTSSACLD